MLGKSVDFIRQRVAEHSLSCKNLAERYLQDKECDSPHRLAVDGTDRARSVGPGTPFQVAWSLESVSRRLLVGTLIQATRC
jgi:hypothetical protein